MNVELVTIVTVPQEQRVKCQHEGCGRHVYSKIHVVRKDDEITFVGQTCFRKLFGVLNLAPSFGGKGSTSLTEAEREQILQNSEEFLRELQSRYDAQEPTPTDETELQLAEPDYRSEPIIPRVAPILGKPTHVHLFRCLTCSTPLINYEFESTERKCPQCNTADMVFTLEKYPISN